MKYIIFLLSFIVSACAPTLAVKVSTRSGDCQLSEDVDQVDRNTLRLSYFCGSESNVVVLIKRIDK